MSFGIFLNNECFIAAEVVMPCSYLVNLTIWLLMANLVKYKIMQKSWKMTETMACGYSCESTQ